MQEPSRLSLADKWRVSGFVYRGEAPEDPRLAAAAVALAERYQWQGHMRLTRRLAIVTIVLMVPASAYAILDGDTLKAVLFGLLALIYAAHLRSNPATQPENVARSLEASRRVIASGS